MNRANLLPVGKVATALAFVVLPVIPAQPCGWWGDGEMSKHYEEARKAPDGSIIPTTLDLATAKLPGREGYGMAVIEPGKAVPYLLATFGRPLVRIEELKAFDFVGVIDLGNPASTAELHRVETEAAGMRYFSIAVASDTPSIEQTRDFARMVAESGEGALLVHAPTAALLAFMWAAHRLESGAPADYAAMQGRLLGMTPEQETVLRSRAGGRR